MKDFIVLIAMIVLGVAIAALIIGFKSKAKTMSDNAMGSIADTFGGGTTIS